VVITDAERSQGDQLHSREVRYLLMMSIRALCLVAAAVLVGTHAPLLWLWIPICLVGMVVVPWLAVLLANDRPPRRRGQPVDPPGAAPPGDEPPALPPGTSIRIIDADEI
jgi:Flp pilus assembly protein TadB